MASSARFLTVETWLAVSAGRVGSARRASATVTGVGSASRWLAHAAASAFESQWPSAAQAQARHEARTTLTPVGS